ncbi:MAG: type I glyceraldehyde-3-phosphate dehydrogenase [Candidatus Magasanikbacteria bacterium CG11_big_fil_rev_8_21_14_0_20_39_34]|uniref:Type I glyceraldehyde-3-phosphate dehydrogenase n=1 Tax=Candidatus Magasanikbacteria bacterium CG11_big_fil_rev_8_21_14_0_20_39_34 TaxID=1974653 RepID=A0A2H0N8A7_9BACT|nr:MAG: type I glyceraldehyde-3-phosphate dehydrogenase [Candidatus Magasanikbacteria bacterium CG11_big_fil_rev_8_21_14_0_20_39_34]
MKKIRVAINGFGRIGRHAFKVAWEKKNIEVVAINDLTDTKTLAHLLKYDTAYPNWEKKVICDEKSITVAGKKIFAYAERDPEKLPWKRLKIDVVVESTGFFRDEIGASKHLTAGAKKVIISAPAKDASISSYVRGINCHIYKNENIVDNASCTTNCSAPVAQVIHKKFGIEKAMLTTIHSYTTDQNLQDGPHKDLRRARAAAQNMVPTSTGAALAVTKVIPELSGKFDGLAVRVPTITVSLTDFTFLLDKPVTEKQINEALVSASKKEFKGLIETTTEELVSTDFIGNPHSSIVDLSLTKVVGGNLVKVVAWYDNEWGYANRLVEMIQIVAKKKK